MDEIPPTLVINLDQTGIHYVPAGSWTMRRKGQRESRSLQLITAIFAGIVSGDFLPPQLIYKGTTHRCLPTVVFPHSWDITRTENHWSNENTMVQYMEKTIFPYIKKTRSELKLQEDQCALLIFDQFKGQVSEKMFKLLDENHVNIVVVPANCTDCLQPLDISVNKSVKSFFISSFKNGMPRKFVNSYMNHQHK